MFIVKSCHCPLKHDYVSHIAFLTRNLIKYLSPHILDVSYSLYQQTGFANEVCPM